MKLIFSVRRRTITNVNGQVLYMVTTHSGPSRLRGRQRYGEPRGQRLRLLAGAMVATGFSMNPETLENDEQHGFIRLGEIEWDTVAPSRLRRFGDAGGSLSVGEVDAKDFIPPKGILRRYGLIVFR